MPCLIRSFAASTAALLLTPAAVWCQPPTAMTDVVTEAEFVAAVESEHPAFRAAGERLGLAEAARVRASTLADPTLSAGREDPSGPGVESEIALSWQPPGPARRAAVDAAELATKAAAGAVAVARLELRLAVRRAHAEWALATAEVAELAAHAERFASLAERERRRAEAGESSGLDARRLELAAAAARARLAIAEAAEARAREEAVGWYPGLPAGARAVLPALPAVNALRAAAEHPRIAALEAELAAAERFEEAASRFVAFPELTAGWKREEGEAGSAQGPVLGLAWRLPLFDRNRAERAAAAVRRESAAARHEAAQREMAAQRAGARAAYTRLAAAAAEAHRAAAEAAPAVTAVEAAFRAGEAATTDLLDTLRAVTGARLSALELHTHALAAHRDWERTAGGFSGDTP